MIWPFQNPAKNFFTKEEGEKIVEAIKQAELNTSGEIRVHIENKCKKPIFQCAGAIFQKLEMHKTEQRNGVLVYFAVEDHKFAVFADEGINQVVSENFWEDTVKQMKTHFQQKDFLLGLVNGITSIGEQLKTYFPRQDDDENELPDEISFG